jgi:putative membrane protein
LRRSRSAGVAALLAVLAAPPALAHVEAAEAAGRGFEAWVVGALVLSALLYAAGVARLWRRAGRGRGITPRQVLAFAAGWAVTAAALVGPLDALGARLFVAHMVQHEALMIVAAPLFVVARPLAAWTWALPPSWRRGAGGAFHHPAWRRPWLVATAPLGAWALHALALWVWHVPRLFDAALFDDGIHALQHLSFFGAALLYWWSVLGDATRRGGGAALLSLFTTMVHTSALGALLALSPAPWYAGYAGVPALGLDALEDQQLGGLVMWVPAGLAYVACGLAVAARGLREAPAGGRTIAMPR